MGIKSLLNSFNTRETAVHLNTIFSFLTIFSQFFCRIAKQSFLGSYGGFNKRRPGAYYIFFFSSANHFVTITPKFVLIDPLMK